MQGGLAVIGQGFVVELLGRLGLVLGTDVVSTLRASERLHALFRCLLIQMRIGDGANTVSGSTVSNTELSEFFGAH